MTEDTATAAEAYERATDGPESPLDGSELVIYTADTEYALQEPTHETLEELGLVSFSLWARWEDKGVEIPLLAEASWHIWYSLSADSFHPDPADPVTDAFVAAIVEMVDEDVGDGWGDIHDETWENTRDIEKYIVHLVRDGFLEQQAAEPAMVIDWCKKQYRNHGSSGGADDAE